MDIIERVARAIAGANMDERINLYEDDAKAAIAALADDDLIEAGSKAALASTPTVSEDDTYIIIRAYLQSLKEDK